MWRRLCWMLLRCGSRELTIHWAPAPGRCICACRHFFFNFFTVLLSNAFPSLPASSILLIPYLILSCSPSPIFTHSLSITLPPTYTYTHHYSLLFTLLANCVTTISRKNRLRIPRGKNAATEIECVLYRKANHVSDSLKGLFFHAPFDWTLGTQRRWAAAGISQSQSTVSLRLVSEQHCSGDVALQL